MQLSYLFPGLITLAALTSDFAVAAHIVVRQQSSTTTSSSKSTSSTTSVSSPSTFTSTVTTQCYTSRLTTQPTRSASTTSNVGYMSGSSTRTIRATVTITPTSRTRTITSTVTVTTTPSTSNNGIATVTTTSASLVTTTSISMSITTTTSTITVTPTTIPTSPGFQPVQTTLRNTAGAPESGSSRRDLSVLSHLLESHQRPGGWGHGWGNQPHYSWGRGRPRNYSGDVSCLVILATGTVTTTTRTITSTASASTVTTTITTTRTQTLTTSAPTSAIPVSSTTTVTTFTTSTITFRQLLATIQTETTTQSQTRSLSGTSSAAATPTLYAACLLPSNNITRLTLPSDPNNGTPSSRPIIRLQTDTTINTYSGNSDSPYTCCVSTITNPNGAIWAWSANYGCLVFVLSPATAAGGQQGQQQGQCPGGQAALNGRRAEVDLGALGGGDEFTIGNGYCGGWNVLEGT